MSDLVPSAAQRLAAFRAAFPITRERVYLFSGGLAPAATPVRASMTAWMERWTHDPLAHRDDYHADLQAVRRLLAGLLRVGPAAIAITDTTSRASNLAVRLIPLAPGANVVVDATTHPSTLHPWSLPDLRDVTVRRVEGPLSSRAVAAAVDGHTAAVIVSHVDGLTGFRHDTRLLGHAVHAAGGVLLVDAAQSVGAVDVDLVRDGIDLLTGLSMKWLLGPPGIGFLAVSPRVRMDAVPPPHLGYLATTAGSDGELLHAPDGRRHELGIGNLAGYAGFRAALELIATTGMDAIEPAVLALAVRAIAGLQDLGVDVLTPPGAHAGVVAFRLPSAVALAAELRAGGVDAWGYPEPGRVRVDPHAFNTADEVDRFLAGVARHLAGRKA